MTRRQGDTETRSITASPRLSIAASLAMLPLVPFAVSAPLPAPSPTDAYLAEARALSERLSVIDPDEFKRRFDATLELRRRIGSLDEKTSFELDQVRFHFTLAQVLVSYRRQQLRQGLRERARQTHAKLRRIELEQLARIEHLERLLK